MSRDKYLQIFISFLFLYLIGAAACAQADQEKFKTMRQKMVEHQLKRRDIKDKGVLQAMAKVERHLFVPESVQLYAYNDNALPIGFGQTISQPYMVAIMTQCLELKGDEKVLEIGTGSGYQAAILSILAKEVYTIEIIEGLGQRATQTLKQYGFDNVRVKIGDGFLGWPEQAPFDGIIITCAVNKIPGPLVEQLAIGGRMVLPIGETLRYQKLKVLTKEKNGKLKEKYILDCVFVPMTGKHGW
jgi:protein-L-isoaspartate(D-aspartate) O-methyltransferase